MSVRTLHDKANRPLCGSTLHVAYHPRLAAEVVDGEERVAARHAAEMQADHQVPEVLPGDHAVGVLADQDEVRLEGPAAARTREPSEREAWSQLP